MHLKPIISGIVIASIIFFIIIFIKGSPSRNIFQFVSPISEDSQSLSEVSGVLDAENTSFDTLVSFIKSIPGDYGLYIKNLSTKQEYKYKSDSIFWAASLYKIVVGGAVYDLINQDKLSLNYVYVYESVDYQDGTGLIQNDPVGTTYTVDELLDLLFKHSDNIAQNILVRNISLAKVGEFYGEICPEYGTMMEDQTTSPERIAGLLINLYNNSSWPRQMRREFFTRMIGTEFDDRISVGLSDDLIFAHKIGNLPDELWHDCGIVFDANFENPVAVCLMSSSTGFDDFVGVSKEVARFINSQF